MITKGLAEVYAIFFKNIIFNSLTFRACSGGSCLWRKWKLGKYYRLPTVYRLPRQNPTDPRN